MPLNELIKKVKKFLKQTEENKDIKKKEKY